MAIRKQESSEDYLETIYRLKQTMANVRSIDIVNDMGFSKPSVSIAMKNLREKNLIVMDNDGYITLTDEGAKIAQNVFERHNLLVKMFVSLGVSEEIATEDACRIEHDLSEETYKKIKEHFLKMQK